MSNGDTERKSRVVRVYKDDDESSDQWIDVERLDELSFSSGRGEQFRRKVWKFDWDELFNPDGENVTKKKIKNPKDEENFIEVPVRKSVLVREASGEQYQRYRHHFLNDVSNQTRKTVSRRVYHHEIKKLYLEDGKPPSEPERYLDSLGRQDKEQYVEVELLDRYWTDQIENRDPQSRLKEATWQVKKWVLTEADSLLKEPMRETDEADPDFIPVHNPEAGPKVDPPWRLDPLQNIVNVSWAAGAVFISADTSSFVRRLDMENKQSSENWADLGALEFTVNGLIYGSSYAKIGAEADGSGGTPTFILVGTDDGGTTGDELGIIMSSSDGSTWSKVRTVIGGAVGDGNSSATMLGVVWNKADKCFYAGANFHELIDDVIHLHDVLLQSDDGQTWREAGRNEVAGDTNINGLLAQKCSGAVEFGDISVPVLDSDGHAVPDGVYGFDKQKKILMAPNIMPTIHYGFGGINITPSSLVKITTLGPDATSIVTTTVDVGIPVACVAYAAGIWMAAGGTGDPLDAGSGIPAAAYSIDDGETWKVKNPSGGDPSLFYFTFTMIAAPKNDL